MHSLLAAVTSAIIIIAPAKEPARSPRVLTVPPGLTMPVEPPGMTYCRGFRDLSRSAFPRNAPRWYKGRKSTGVCPNGPEDPAPEVR